MSVARDQGGRAVCGEQAAAAVEMQIGAKRLPGPDRQIGCTQRGHRQCRDPHSVPSE
jgi:hypothetical protein